MISINEIYGPVLQGEGVSLGVPVLFIRLSGCNLHCSWCDSSQTWNFEGTDFKHDYAAKVKLADERIVQKEEELAAHIRLAVKQAQVSRIVLSGGEPLVQQKQLVHVIKELPADLAIEVETNGTFEPSQTFDAFVSQYNVSPKLRNSSNPDILRERPAALRFFVDSPKAWFKYVVEKEDDLQEIQHQIEKYQIPKNKILLMPLGHDQESQTNSMHKVEKLCLKYGYRLSPRLHVLLHGYKRGI